jgi:hypothetical protein
MTGELTFSPLPSKYIPEHYINVTVKTRDKHLTRLVNEQTGASVPISFTDIAGLEYSYAKVRVNVATHSLKNEAGFTAYAYGAGNADSYGYLVGARFNHLPEPTLVRDTVYCVGEKPQPLSVYDGNDLLWYTSADFGQEAGSPVAPTFGTGQADTLVFYVSQLVECSESPRRKVSIIIENPPADPTVGTAHSESSASFCRGNSEVLQAEAAYAGSFEWYKDNKRLPGVAGSTLTVTETGVYYVRAKSEHSCYAANSSNLFRVTAHELPADPTVSAPLPGDSVDICRDGSTTLTARSAGADAFEWFRDGRRLNGAAGATLAVTTGGAYHVETTAGACRALHPSRTIGVAVHELPTVAIAGAPYFCEGRDTALTASGADTYRWSTGQTTAGIAAGAAGTYAVAGTDRYGCTGTAQATITESPQPVVQLAPADTTVCHGDTVTPAVVSLTGAIAWNVAVPAVILHPQAIIATATNVCGSRSDTTRVAHTPLPANPTVSAAAAGDSVSLCQGDSVSLTAASDGADAFAWFCDGRRVNGAAGDTLTVTATGAYHVETATGGGCRAALPSRTIGVAVHELPDAPALPNAAICKDDIARAPNMSDAYTLLWYDAESRPIGEPPLQSSVTGASTYHISQKDNTTGCESPAVAWVYTVNGLPEVTVAGAPYYCEGRDTALTASGAVRYRWSTGDTTAGIAVHAAGIYTVTGADRNGCTGTAQATVEERPAPQVTANNDTVVCYGDAVVLGTLRHTGVIGWSGPLSVAVTRPATYTVTASNECGTAVDEMVVDVVTPALVAAPDLPPYKYKEYYRQQLFTDDPGRPVYLRWAGSLPGGLSITPDGVLCGMPAVTGRHFDSHRFTVFLEDSYGCEASQSFLLTPLFHAPNAIIRDGGTNSRFLPDFDLEIFNRQGILLHRGRGWLGTSGSTRVPTGTYFYKVEVMQDGVPRQYMGYIAVLE